VTDQFRAYRPWFWAAIVYNLTWGISLVIYPRWFLWSANMTDSATPLAQAAGMMVAVYAYGYYSWRATRRATRRSSGLRWRGRRSAQSAT
jgi:hypothetical protein